MADPKKFNRGKFLKELKEFTGTTKYYSYILGYRLTDGSKFIADECGAYWLMDVIASYILDKRISGFHGIQFWVLEVNLAENEGVVKCFTTDQDNPAITQKIPYTDFPLEKIELYCQDKVIYLPREN